MRARHDWTPGLCLYCGNFCTQCNDCQCPGRGWRNYAASKCPGFDTKAGWLRPPKPGTSEHYANKLLDKILKEGT